MADAIGLKFIWPAAATPGPVSLRFGAPDQAAAPDIEGALAASLPVTLLPLTAALSGTYRLDLPDADGPGIHAPQGDRRDQATPLRQGHNEMAPGLIPADLPHGRTLPLPVALLVPISGMLPGHRGGSIPHRHGLLLGQGATHRWADAIRLRHRLAGDHRHGLTIGTVTGAVHAEYIRFRHRLALPAAVHGSPLAQGMGVGQHQARYVGRRLYQPQQQMLHPAPGWWQGVFPWPDAAEPPPGLDPTFARLLFCLPAGLGGPVVLRFGCLRPPEQIGTTIPIREVYLVINSFSLVRESDLTPIPCTGFQADLDADSWTWSWSARIPAQALPLLAPAQPGSPRVVIATLNGQPLRLLVESIKRDRRFGSAWLTIRGRGAAAWLADPYAAMVDRSAGELLTAQQLLAAALTINHVPMGWDLDWQIEDWLVPAGVWSHSGTHMAAALRIAEAGGGYIQGHDTADILRVLPRYPTPPWQWHQLTPELVLPEDVVETEGIEWRELPPYNAVWVVGGDQGRRDRIRRTGTAADHPAPTIVDPLATDTVMTRQRGQATLGATGRQAIISLRLPVLPETGIIHPGIMLDYTESGTPRRGITRGVSLQHDYPELWQTIRVETHEYE